MLEEVCQEIQKFLSGNDELLRDDRFREHEDPLAGHCYVATEALYHYVGGRDSEYTPCQMTHEGESHWFLRTPTGEVIDLTSSQFETQPDYSDGRGRGFQNTPSSRCKRVLDHLREEGFDIPD